MTTQDTLMVDENTRIKVEFSSKGGFSEVSSSPVDVARKSAEALNEAMDTIQQMAQRVNATIKQLNEPPAVVEVDFGIKFTSEMGAVIAKAGIDCNINIKLTWKQEQKMPKPLNKK